MPLRAEGVKLTLAVIDDPALAAAIGRRRGEWAARSGGSLQVVELTAADATTDKPIAADALVYPSWLLGTFVARKAIIHVRRNVLEGRLLAIDDILPIVRRHSMAWGDRVMAVPLGSPVLTLWYRADLFTQLHLSVPATWDDYQQLTERLRDRSRLGPAAPPAGDRWYATVEPLATPWAAHLLLARAASYARDSGSYSALFDIQTMRPLIADPAFVRALEQLRSTVAPLDLPSVDPAGSFRLLRDGHAAMALTWATAAESIADPAGEPTAPATDPTPPALGVAMLPGSHEVFRTLSHTWQPRSKGSRFQVPTIGLAGRIGSVTSSTHNAPTAMQLLAWLSGPELSGQVSPASRATTLFRQTHLKSPENWVPEATPAALANDYARVVAKALDADIWLGALRIPAADRYVAALDTAVRQALAGAQQPAEALQQVARKWEAITREIGVDSQKKAYSNSLGL